MGGKPSEALLRFLRDLNRGQTLAEVARTVLRYAIAIVPGAQSGTLLVLNEDSGAFEYVAAEGWDLDLLAPIRIPRERIIQRELPRDRPAIVRRPYDLSRRLPGKELAAALASVGPVEVFLTLPITDSGEVIGYLNLDNREDPDAFSEDDFARLDLVWEEITLAVRAARNQERLAESERLFRFLFERLADAVYITALDGTILEANPAAERQTGYAREELLRMNVMRDLAAEEPAITYAEVNERLLRGEVVAFDELKRRKDGSTFWTECHVSLIEYRGQPATVSVNRDVTDRKHLEGELVNRIAQLEAFSRIAPTIAGHLDSKEVVQSIVTAARELARADHANILLFDAKGVLVESFDPRGAPPIPVRVRPKGFSRWILDTGQPLLIEDIRADGKTDPPVRATAGRPIRASPVLVKGGIRSLVGVPIRVGKSHRAILYVHSRHPAHLTPYVPVLDLLAAQAGVALENALLYETLQESEARYRALFEQSPVSLWIEDFSVVARKLESLKARGVTDLAALLGENPHLIQELLALVRVEDVNRTTLDLYRVRDKEELLARLPELIPEEVYPLFAAELQAMWEGRTEFHGEGINRAADGKPLHIHLGWRVLPGHERTYDRVLVSILDITERVEAEEAAARRDAVLGAVAFAAERFLRGGELDREIPTVLAQLGEAADVSRVYIFQVHDGEREQPRVSQRFEWVAPGIAPQIENPALQSLPLVEIGFSRWAEAFSRGEAIHGLVREFPPEEQPVLVAQGILSLVAVPIIVARRWWGFLGFDECRRERVWTRSEVEALQAAARALGAAIGRTMLEKDLRAVNADLQGLYEVSIALGTSLDLSAVFQRIYEEVRQLIPCDAFTLALVDEARNEFRLAFAVEEGQRLPELVVPLDPQQSLTAWIASTKEPLLIGDFEREKDRLPAAAQQVGKAVRSWLGVPLLYQNEVLGVLTVQSFAPRVYAEKHLRLLRTVSAAVATALRNARTYTELVALERRLRDVEDVSRRMKLASDRGALYALVLDLVDRLFGYRSCAVLEREGDDLVVVAEHGYLSGMEGLRLPLAGNGITVAAFRSGGPVYVPNVATDPRYVHEIPETRCELALPLTIGERVLGVLDVQTPRADGIPPQDQDLLKIVASELAVAMAGLERHAQVKALGDRLAGLHEIVSRLQGCRSVDQACAIVVSEASRILGFSTCNVGLVEGDRLVPMASTSGDAVPRPRGEGVAWRTLESGRTICGNVDDFPFARPVRPEIRSVLSCPIGDRGVFQAVSERRDAFGPDDVLVAETLAGHLRDTLRRIEVEHELHEQAIRDPLTGLYNRRFLAEVLQREIERAKRYGHPLTLILADVDDFKLVNDRYGHLVGDAALRRVAEVLRGSVRAGDYVFRYGGEEFVIVLPETGDGGGDALRRLKEETAGITVDEVPGPVVSLSLGHVVWNPVHDGPTTVETLLRRADEVLYAIKRRRGGR
ncbi:GAF domain-containing protein [Candidatus Bipolaricaulota bacterium]|nr:GAF domain-containing protein [Candidatus Bipolaricaulota bacterium]